jgi:lysophospholipase L1-like esterase
MPWTQQFQDTFVRSNGAIGNGWTDRNSVWSISSNTLTSASTSFVADALYRPIGESLADQRVVVQLPNNATGPMVLLRYDPVANAGYMCYLDSGGTELKINWLVGGASGPWANSGTFAQAAGDVLMTCDVVGTLITVSLATVAAPGTVIASVSYNDTTNNFPTGQQALFPLSNPNTVKSFTSYTSSSTSFAATPSTIPANHNGNISLALVGSGTTWSSNTFTVSGVSGIAKVSQSIAGGTHATLVISLPAVLPATAGNTGPLTISDGSLSATVTVAAPTLSISPTSGTTGTTPTLALTGANTIWSHETAAGLFTVSGGTGASIATPSVSADLAASDVLTVGSGTGTLTVKDTSTGATATFTATGTPPVAITALTESANDPTGITFTCTVSSGTPNYTAKLYQSTTNPFTPPGSGTLAAMVTQSGTSVSLKDTSPGTGDLYYRMRVVDSAGTPTTATSVQSASQVAIPAKWRANALNLAVVGDSITAQVTDAAGIIAQLQNEDQSVYVTTINSGVNGATTADWAPGGTFLTPSIAAYVTAGVQWVWIMLGTNDAKTAVTTSVGTYSSRLAATAAAYVTAGFKVVINPPPFVVPGSLAGAFDETAPGLLASYRDAIPALANGTTIFAGIPDLFNYSAQNPASSDDGVHPNSTGRPVMENMWVRSFADAQIPSGGGSQVFPVLGSGFIKG